MDTGSLTRIKAVVLKESRQVIRDPSSILIAFVLPAILLILFAFAINMDARDVRIGVALESSEPAAYRLAQAFRATPYFRVDLARDRRELLDKVTRGELRGIVIIPPDFARRLITHTHNPVLVITDGSETNTANFVRNYAAGVINIWQQAQAQERSQPAEAPITLQFRYWYNADLKSSNTLVPGSIAIIMAIVGTLLTSMVVAREWERGTMEALLSTPIRPAELLIGKIVPYLLLGLGSFISAVWLTTSLFDVPYRGGIPALLLVGGSFLLTALGQGFMISTLTKNQFLASMIALITAFLPAFLLSGFIFEIASMPFIIRQITRIIPARYLVTNLKTLFLVGDVWAVILPNVLFLLLIAALFFTITLKKSPSTLGGNE